VNREKKVTPINSQLRSQVYLKGIRKLTDPLKTWHSLNIWNNSAKILIQEELKSGLNSNNAYCHPVQSLLSSRLLSKTVKIIIHKIIILPAVLYGSESWSDIKGEKITEGV
jgi:hypothetical protein